jgi:hypothetical protein
MAVLRTVSPPAHPDLALVPVETDLSTPPNAMMCLSACGGGARAQNGSVAVDEKDGAKLYEVTAERSFPIAKPGPGGALGLQVGPMFDHWTLAGEADTRRVGAHAAVSIEWPIVGRLTGAFRGAAELRRFQRRGLPSEHAQCTRGAARSRRASTCGSSPGLARGEHPPAHCSEPPAHRSVEHPVAYPHHHPAQDGPVGSEVGPHLLA